jgi:hypothetical protein
MSDYSLVPVDYQLDFSDVSLVPVDHDSFGADDAVQQAQAQLAQPQPENPPQQSATGVGQPNVGTPAVGGSAPGGSQGGDGLSPSGGDAGGDLNPTSDQGGSEPAPFDGYANPTPTEAFVAQGKMKDQERAIDAREAKANVIEGGKTYHFVTTGPSFVARTDADTGVTFIATSPFYGFDGTHYATFDASPEHPVRVTVTSDNKLTISPP